MNTITILNYEFTNKKLLETALTHSSYCHEHPKENSKNNERLEFLGDAVIDLVSAHVLLKKFPHLTEGGLSKMRNTLVQEKSLVRFAQKIELDKFIRAGKGENKLRPSLLADTFEALIGAIYLDSGFDEVKKVLLKIFSQFSEAELYNLENINTDYKSRLQELVLKEHRTLPHYKEKAVGGGQFNSSLYIRNNLIASAVDSSKKKAQIKVAEFIILNKLYKAKTKKRGKSAHRTPASRQ